MTVTGQNLLAADKPSEVIRPEIESIRTMVPRRTRRTWSVARPRREMRPFDGGGSCPHSVWGGERSAVAGVDPVSVIRR